MDYNIDTLYLELDYSHKQRLLYFARTKSSHSYIQRFKQKDGTFFDFKYTVEIFEIENHTFKVKQFKRGVYRLEAYGLHQYHKNGRLKENNFIQIILPLLKYCRITRLDLCKDSKAKPQTKNLRTKKLVNYKSTIYHNLYNKNYFSSYTYNKQAKNKLSKKIWRTEFSFKGILRAKSWRFQLRHLSKLIRRSERFIDDLKKKAKKINSLS